MLGKKRLSASKKMWIFVVLFLVTFLGIIGILFHLRSSSSKAHLQYANVPGATLAYSIRGEGTPLILLEGFGMTMDKWDPLLIEQLSKKHQVILFDYRGVGNSTGDIASLSETQMAQDTVALLDQLQIKKSAMLGWSMGSFIAQIIAEQYPNRVNKLILVSTAPGGKQIINSPDSDTIGNIIQNNLADTWENVFVPFLFSDQKQMKAYMTRVEQEVKTGTFPTDSPETVQIRIAQEKALSNTQEEQARSDKLSIIQAPTLIIAGAKDTIVDPQNDTYVAQHIPGAIIHILPDAGHAVLFEKDKESLELINNFL